MTYMTLPKHAILNEIMAIFMLNWCKLPNRIKLIGNIIHKYFKRSFVIIIVYQPRRPRYLAAPPPTAPTIKPRPAALQDHLPVLL